MFTNNLSRYSQPRFIRIVQHSISATKVIPIDPLWPWHWPSTSTNVQSWHVITVRLRSIRTVLSLTFYLSVCLSVCLSNACIVTKRKHLAKKFCYKVSLCENFHRQSCKAFTGLSIGAQTVGGGHSLRPALVLGNLCKYRHRWYIAKTRFFGLHFRRRLYRSIFDHFDVIGPWIYRIRRKNAR